MRPKGERGNGAASAWSRQLQYSYPAHGERCAVGTQRKFDDRRRYSGEGPSPTVKEGDKVFEPSRPWTADHNREECQHGGRMTQRGKWRYRCVQCSKCWCCANCRTLGVTKHAGHCEKEHERHARDEGEKGRERVFLVPQVLSGLSKFHPQTLCISLHLSIDAGIRRVSQVWLGQWVGQ